MPQAQAGMQECLVVFARSVASIQQPPERVVIDTNQPTIVPPPSLFETSGSGSPSPLQSYASVDPSPMVVDLAKKLP